MGGVAVLHPQDCLRDSHQTLINSHMKPRRNPNPNPNPNPTRSNRRKRSPEKNKSRQALADNFPAQNLVMGQVKLLKRGEELSALKKNPWSGLNEKKPKDEAGDLDVLSSAGLLGPAPEMVPKQVRLGDFYAGSAFITSPPPSSLPLPAFFAKKSLLTDNDCDDDATTDLRRLLRLDLL